MNIYENIILWGALVCFISLSGILLQKVWFNAKSKNVVLAYVLFVFFSFISTIYSVNILVSLGYLFFNVFGLIVFINSSTLFESKLLKKRLLVFILFLVSILSAASFYNTVMLRYVNYETEGLSYMWLYWGHNHLAALLLVGIPINLFLIRAYYKRTLLRYFLLILLLFLSYSLLISFSRGALLSLIIVSGYFALSVLIKSSRRLNTVTNILLILTVFILMFLYTVWHKSNTGIISRYYHFDRGLNIFLSHPLTGSGPGTYGLVYLEGKPAKSSFAHNLFVQNLAEGGLPGVFASTILLALIANTCAATIRTNENYLEVAIAAALLALLVNDLWDFDLFTPSVFIIFWLLAGLLYTRNKDVPERGI